MDIGASLGLVAGSGWVIWGLGGGGLGFGFFVFGNLVFAGIFFLGGEDGIG